MAVDLVSVQERLCRQIAFPAHVGMKVCYNMRGSTEGVDPMPTVIDYEQVKTSFPDILEYVAGKKGTVTVMRSGRAAVRISPITVYRTTEPLPELAGQINCDLFADESSDWENA